MSANNFVLVHSPIVGPDTWEPVAGELRARGHRVVVPVVDDDRTSPFWEQHVASVVQVVAGEADEGVVTVVAHSGAGQLLAHVGRALREGGRDVEAYLFVDASLPTEGVSRLEQLRSEAPEYADELEGLFRAGGAFPDWSEELLRELVPDSRRSERLAAGIRRLPFDFWQEEIPTTPGWPDAPCAALLFGDTYETVARQAHDRGWPVHRLDAQNHFLMLVEPDVVAEELIELREELVPPRD